MLKNGLPLRSACSFVALIMVLALPISRGALAEDEGTAPGEVPPTEAAPSEGAPAETLPPEEPTPAPPAETAPAEEAPTEAQPPEEPAPATQPAEAAPAEAQPPEEPMPAAQPAEAASTGTAPPATPAPDATTTETPAAGAGTEVTPTAPEEAGAAEPEAAAGKAEARASEARSVLFEYIEDLTISGPGGADAIHLKANTLVAVTTDGERITVEVRPQQTRQPSEQDDPAPGRITMMSSETPAGGWDIRPQTVVFSFRPGPKGVVSVEGAAKDAANEAIAVLSQGPYENTSTEGCRTEYEIELRSNGQELKLAGVQSTEKLWVDWDLEGGGSFKVGSRGWELPMTFALPPGPLDKRGIATISSEARMCYSSIRPGPEDDTTLETTLTLKRRKDEYSYVRRSKLRPKGPLVEEASEAKSSGPRAKGALAGGASAWARTATLATLGVQRLAGVRETGLAMWLAQAAIDSAAGRVVPRAADRPQRRTVRTVAKLSPLLEPVEGIIREVAYTEKWLVRFEAGQTFATVASDTWVGVGADVESAAEIMVPDLSLSVRREFKKKWRLGGGVDALMVRLDTGDPQVSWSFLGLSARAEYLARRWNAAVAVGMASTSYEMDSKTRTASGDLRTPLFGLDLEALLGKRFGLGLRARLWGDIVMQQGGLGGAYLQPAFRWYFSKNAALQVHGLFMGMYDDQAVGGTLGSFIDFGKSRPLGVGVLMRW